MIDDKYEDIIKQKIEKELSELGSSFESEISEDENKEDEIDVSNNIVKISNSISEILNELVMNNSLKKDNKQKKEFLIQINL